MCPVPQWSYPCVVLSPLTSHVPLFTVHCVCLCCACVVAGTVTLHQWHAPVLPCAVPVSLPPASTSRPPQHTTSIMLIWSAWVGGRWKVAWMESSPGSQWVPGIRGHGVFVHLLHSYPLTPGCPFISPGRRYPLSSRKCQWLSSIIAGYKCLRSYHNHRLCVRGRVFCGCNQGVAVTSGARGVIVVTVILSHAGSCF